MDLTEKQKEIIGKMIPILGTFINWTDSESSAMLGYMSGLISDLTPLLTIIIGVAVGIIIVGAILRAIRG